MPGTKKISSMPRKNIPADDLRHDSINLPPLPQETHRAHEMRIRPKEPKTPFVREAAKIAEPQSGTTGILTGRKKHRRAFLSFFRSRRKGSYRIMNFIVLPIAFALTVAFIVWLLKFH